MMLTMLQMKMMTEMPTTIMTVMAVWQMPMMKMRLPVRLVTRTATITTMMVLA